MRKLREMERRGEKLDTTCEIIRSWKNAREYPHLHPRTYIYASERFNGGIWRLWRGIKSLANLNTGDVQDIFLEVMTGALFFYKEDRGCEGFKQ